MSGSAIEVFLVEDNPGDVRLIQEAFDQLDSEIAMAVATDGDEALEALYDRSEDPSASPPDLVLLDLNLPRVDGLEFLETLRGEDENELARLPVIVLTSSAATEDVLECYERSANAYLTKPTDPTEYTEMVQSVESFWIRRAALPPLDSYGDR